MRICSNCDQYRIITLCCKGKIREPQEYDGCYEFEEDGYTPFYDPERPDLIEMRKAREGFVSTQEEKEGEK